MINFTLDKIQLRNVRKYGDEMMEMDFPINNLTVFTGRVGAGKSTIFKAVSMALYGEDGGAKNEKLSIDDMLNEKNGKNLEIHLYFHSTVDNNPTETKYEIHLFHKHSKYNNKLVFVKDGKDISCESKTATYELIEKTIIPKNVYHNVYYFTQQCKNFFTSIPNSEQKEIFNAILDLSDYKCYYENVKDKLSSTESNLKIAENNLQNKNNELQTYRDILTDSIKRLETAKKEGQEKIDRLLKEIENLQYNITAQNLKLDNSVNDQIQDLKVKYEKKKLEIDNILNKNKEECERLNKDFVNNIVENLKNKYRTLRLEQSKDLDSKINEFTIEYNKNLSIIDNCKKECDVEKMKELDGLNSSYNKKIDDIRSKINTLNIKNKELDNELSRKLMDLRDTTQNDVDKYKDEIRSLQATAGGYMFDRDSNRSNILKLQDDLEKYNDSLNEPDAVCSLCGQKLTNKDHIKKHINDIEKQIKEINSTNESLEVKIKDETDKINNLNTILGDIKNKFDTQKKQYTEECENIKSKIKSEIEENESILKNITSELENKRNEIIEKYKEQEQVKTFTKRKLNDDISQKLVLLDTEKKNIDNKLREEYKVEYNKQLEIKNNKIMDFTKLIEDFTNKKKQLDDLYIVKNSSLKQIVENNNKIELNIREMEDTILKDKNEIEELKNPETWKKYFNQLGIDNHKSLIAKTDKDIIVAKDNVTKLTKDYKILDFWKTAFSDSGIKSMLIDAAIPHMNECVTEELNRVAPGKFTVSFDTLSETKSGKIKDKFNINIVNNETQSNGHKKLSGGEKRIIDLCCMCALRSLAEKLYGKRFCHIFYDEILDSLDDECKQQFCANVKYQSTSGCNVTLITHDLPEDVDPDRVFPF